MTNISRSASIFFKREPGTSTTLRSGTRPWGRQPSRIERARWSYRRPPSVTIRNIGCRAHSTNWNSTASSPTTGLYHVIALEKCKAEPGQKFLRALDIETGDITWEVPLTGPVDGKGVAGILGTAGGLLFYGDPAG